MVAIINSGRSITTALSYNEEKVQAGRAVLLHAANFTKDACMLTYYDKVGIFKKYTSLNSRAMHNTVHIFLSFFPSEKISDDTFIAIAANYLNRLGFGSQPYLVYRHWDTPHPHMHLVSTRIQRDGSAIYFSLVGCKGSSVTCGEIEAEFGLMRSKMKKNTDPAAFRPDYLHRVTAGKYTIRDSAGKVLEAVLPAYKFCSLVELNAILSLYHFRADPVREDSSDHRYKGLLYRVLDENGKRVGLPLRASLFASKATLPYLEKRFEENRLLKPSHLSRLGTTIEFALLRKPEMTLESLIAALKSESVNTVIQKSKNADVQEIFFVDHRSKCVFSLAELPESCSAKTIPSGYRKNQGHPSSSPMVLQKKLPDSHKVKPPTYHLELRQNDIPLLNALARLEPLPQDSSLDKKIKKGMKRNRKLMI